MRSLLLLLILIPAMVTASPLPSWNDAPPKAAVLEWLDDVTDEASPDFIPVPERVAVFDNDGTFWCERPSYPSTLFQVHMTRYQAERGVIDATEMPFSAWFADDRDALREYGWRDAYQAMTRALAGLPVQAFRDSSRAFMDRSRHPEYGVPFQDLYYAPMLELARLLESRGFQVWIVTGSEQDFMRGFVFEATGVPPERVIGSWTPAVADMGDPIVTRRTDVQVYNGHEAKPANIDLRIGRRPVFVAGNSNNDEPMSVWALQGPRRAFTLWIHHDDAEREYAYDNGTDDMAAMVRDHADAYEVSIRRDWNDLYPGDVAK